MVYGADSNVSLNGYAQKAKATLLEKRAQREAYDAQVAALKSQKQKLNVQIKSYFSNGKQAPSGLEKQYTSLDSKISDAQINQHVSAAMEQNSVFSYMRTGGAA